METIERIKKENPLPATPDYNSNTANRIDERNKTIDDAISVVNRWYGFITQETIIEKLESLKINHYDKD